MDHLTGNGLIRVRRVVYWTKGQGRDERLERWLGILDSRVSVAVRELCCRVSVSGVSFTKGAENLERLAQMRITKDWVRIIVDREGQRVERSRREGQVGPNWLAGDCRVSPEGPTRVMVGMDGVMVPQITEAEKRKRRENLRRKRAGRKRRPVGRRRGRPRRGADQPYKEFKIAAFYDQSREHQYAFGTSGDCHRMGRLLRREAAKVKLDQADQPLSLSDGAEWIRRQLQIQLPMLLAMILDFCHLAEHVAQASRSCFGEGTPVAEGWTHERLNTVREKGPVPLLAQLEQTLAKVRAPAKRKALHDLQQYVVKRADMLDYPRFRQQGFDIGSGPTEAFCKTLTARLKGSGMRWDRPNAEAMMALAALEHSHLWKPYWHQQLTNAA